MSVQNRFSSIKWNKKVVHILLARIMHVFIALAFLFSAVGVNPVLAENSLSRTLKVPSAAPSSAPNQQTATWFDSAWNFRRSVPVSNSGPALTDYDVLITLDASFDFSKANSDGSDLRFTMDTGTSLPFWVETWDPDANLARIWVRVPSIPTAGVTIYLYYGNPGASSVSNGSDTFKFFDDAWLNLTSRWHINNGVPLVNDGIVSFAGSTTIQTQTTYLPGHALGFKGWFKSGGGAYKWGGFLNAVNPPYTYIGTVGEAGYPNVVLTNNLSGSRVASDLGLPTDAFHIYEMTWTPSEVRAFMDRAISPTGSLSENIPTTSLPIQLGNYNDTRATFEVDWVYLRNYQEPEPTFTLGVEEGNQSADLEVAVTDSPDPVMAGSSLTYAITVSNHGPLDATSVALTDTLPAEVTFVSATPSQGSCTGTDSVSCDLGSIASASVVTVSIIVSPVTAGTLENSAHVSSSEPPDFNETNNSASTTTIVNDLTTADLGITQSDSPDPARAGEPLTYTLMVTNQGPADATGVTVTNTLPSTVTFVSATPSQGDACTGTTNLTCGLGSIAKDGSATVTIVVTPTAAGTITNQATVSGDNRDLQAANNSVTESTHVGAPSLGAVVLVNSQSPGFYDFEHYVQPYLDNFGVPYTVLDIASEPVGTEVQDFALIIVGHRQLDVGSPCSGAPCLNSTEHAMLSAAVNAGTGLINFDNDLSADGATARYPFIQDVFNFSYSSAANGSGVLFTGAAGSHYITERHQAGESIGTGGMTLADITLPSDATALATTGSAPFLAVRNSGQGRAVQWGTYNWMSYSVKGPVYGLDDLMWRSMAWAARKPFIMQGMPPFLTMRVDDESGPFDWIHVANEFGIKPWAGLFFSNIDEAEAADLSNLVNTGKATTAIHAFDGSWFYWSQTDAQMAANYVAGTQWHQNHNIPISKYVLPHYYQFGSNAFSGLDNWDVECVGTHMNPGEGWGAPWVMNGPFRKYESGGSSGGIPQYYADYMTIPGHPEFNGRFFNLVTEIRDDLGYEWYPNNNVAETIGHGTLQTKRALDSMVLATLFTHDQYISGISMENWRSILQGITTNIESYHPINVTMDYACQYVKSKYGSKIVSSSYDPATRQVAANFSGTTEIPTKFYLFMDDHEAIRDMWVDVPQFSGQTQVLFTLPGELDHIVVTPSTPSIVTGATQQFTAQGYDASNNPIPNLPVAWSVSSGGGTINSNGLFTAGPTPGPYNNTIVASVGSITATASVTVIAPSLDHFTFQAIASPQYPGAPFPVTITARDSSGNLFSGYTGQATLAASVGNVAPVVTGTFSGGSWTGNVTLDEVAENVILTASAGGASGTSNNFDVQGPPTLDHFTIQTIASPQVVNAPFQVVVTARDSAGNPLPVYTGTPTLSASAGTISPDVTGAFVGSTWTGTVALSQVTDNVTITVSDGAATGTSNSFAVEPPPPYYQLTSPSFSQTAGVPFEVTVTAFQTTINLWEDSHQTPVLTTTSDVNTLNYNAAAGNWTEFLYSQSRPYPTILASALHTSTLPTLHFHAGGIPNGRYEVIANLYDNARMRYFFGYTSADPRASSVDTLGNATGTQHREYRLGTVDITTNSFNLYVNHAQLLSGNYDIFGWAGIRLEPAEPASPSDITINLSEDNHQDPVLMTTSDVPTLISNSTNRMWTEFLYTTSRPYPSVMGSALHTPVEPTMHFYSSGIPNGEYQVYANLYDTNPLRYFYGYTSADPNALHVDTAGGASGTQHREYDLGSVNVTDGSFHIYANTATQLPGATYDIFGWAHIRLHPLFEVVSEITLSSSSPTMLFDADGDEVFGEPGDNAEPLVDGTLEIQARDLTPGTNIRIEASDFLGQTGYNTYTIQSSNTPPVATDDSYTTDQDQVLNIAAPGVLDNDTDADNDTLTAHKVTDPAHGTLTLNADGSFVYTPNAGFAGEDTFTYKANDSTADSNIATVSITVDPTTFCVNPGGTGGCVASIQAAIDAASTGATINVAPGTYHEGNLSRNIYTGAPGGPASGLLVYKNGLTIQGVDNSGNPITDRTGVVATIVATQRDVSLGDTVITGDDVTLSGLRFEVADLPVSCNKNVFATGENFTLKDSVVDNLTTGCSGLYLSDERGDMHVNSFTIQDNHFLYGEITVINGVGQSGPASGRKITGNLIEHVTDWGAISLTGITGNGWTTQPIGAVTITGNTLQDNAYQIIARGSDYASPTGYWTDFLADNTFDKAVLTLAPDGDARPDSYERLGWVNDLADDSREANFRMIGTMIQEGIDRADTGDTVRVAAGTYDEDVNLNKSLSLLGAGAGSTPIRGIIGGDGATVRVNANNVEVAGFTITRLGNNPTDWNNAGLNSAGIAIIGPSLTGMNIHDNILSGNRTGIDINNSSGHTIQNNAITDNRTGLIFRNQTDDLTVTHNDITNNWAVGIVFLDASGGINNPVQTALNSTFSNNNISGNWYGQVVDRQTGGSLPLPGTTNLKNFAENWWGTTAPVVSTANSSEPGYASLIPVAYGGTATPPGGQPDILGPASANIVFTRWCMDATCTTFSPEVVVLGAPSGPLTSWDNTFSWTGISGADYYQLEVSDTTDVVLYSQWYTTSICTGLDCAVSPAETLNLANGDYKWKVRTYGVSGFGDWTAFTNFTLDVPTLSLTSPTGTQTSWNNTFSWTGISTADFYQLEVYTGSDARVYSQWYTTGICSALNCAVSPAETQNLVNDDYKWKVRTYGSSGFTAWTDFTSFTLDVPTLSLTSPTGTQTSWNNTFSWTGISTADFYQLEVYTGSDALVYSQWYTTGICTGLDCAVSPAETRNLSNGDYKWKVRTYGSSGFTSWTDFTSFTLDVPTLSLTSPTGTQTTWNNTFSWTGISTADFYQLEVYTGSDTLVHSQWFTSSICNALNCAVSPTETRNLANGDYKWMVRTYGSSGFTAWTEFTNFTLNAAQVVLAAPSGEQTSWDNTFSWTGLAGADFYRLQVYDATGGTVIYDQWYTNSICTDLDCAVAPAETQNLANGDYQWRVQTYGSSGFTAWTTYMDFSLNR